MLSLLFFRGGGGNVLSLALSGVQGSGQVDSVVPGVSLSLSGVQSTGSPGTLVANNALALLGVSESGGVGLLSPSLGLQLSGIQSVTAVDSVVAGISGDVSILLSGVFSTGQVDSLLVTGADVLNVFTQFGGGYVRRKKKKKKLPPVVELENVLIVPQIVPDYEAPIIYRYFGNLSSEITNISVQMVAYQDAMKLAKEENKRIQQKQSDEMLILLAIMED